MNLLSVRLRWDPDGLNEATTGIVELRRSKAGIVGVRVESVTLSSLSSIFLLIYLSIDFHANVRPDC